MHPCIIGGEWGHPCALPRSPHCARDDGEKITCSPDATDDDNYLIDLHVGRAGEKRLEYALGSQPQGPVLFFALGYNVCVHGLYATPGNYSLSSNIAGLHAKCLISYRFYHYEL